MKRSWLLPIGLLLIVLISVVYSQVDYRDYSGSPSPVAIATNDAPTPSDDENNSGGKGVCYKWSKWNATSSDSVWICTASTPAGQAKWARVSNHLPGLVVAASGATDEQKRGADFVCDGTGDQEEINDALDADKGPVYLTKGTFTISSSILFQRDKTVLIGAGRDVTIINFDGNSHDAIQQSGASRWISCRFEGFTIDNTNVARNNGIGMNARSMTFSVFRDLRFRDCNKGLVLGSSHFYSLIEHCQANTNGSGAVGFECEDVANDNSFFRCLVAPSGEGGTGYKVVGNGNKFHDCNCEGSAGTAYDVDGDHTLISGGWIENVTTGIDIDANADGVILIGLVLGATGDDVLNNSSNPLIWLDHDDQDHISIEGGTIRADNLRTGSADAGGIDSAFTGDSAGTSNTGANNCGFGGHALSSVTSGDSNSALGARVLEDLTTGGWNSALGKYALNSVTTGDSNVAVGAQAAKTITTQDYVVAIGRDAFETGTPHMSVAVGSGAGEDNSGSYNVFLGHSAGRMATGSSNVFLGHEAGKNATGSNQLYIERNDTDFPLVYGEFDNDLLWFHDTYGHRSTTADSGGGLRRLLSEATATLSGASTTIQVNVPSGAHILGCQLRVDTAVTSGDGATSWDAAYSGGAAQSIATGQAFTKDTKADKLYDANANSAIGSSEVDIAITPDTGTFSAGVVRAIVYYEELAAMDAAP